jgi:ABC-type dipeptide/oligopeptide/nickel transport system permease component
MLAFIVRRLAVVPVVLAFVVLATFGLMRAMGGSPFRLEFGGLSNALIVQLTSFYGLEEPWYVQLWIHVKHLVTLDFGPSLVDRYVTVDGVIEQRVPVSLELAALAVAWAVPLGGALGVYAALRRGSWLDTLATSVSTVLLVVPVFLFAELFSTYLVWDWGLVPAGWESWRTKLLAAFVLALAPAGYVARLVRAGVVANLDEDYVRTARAKGLRLPRIVGVHVLRNSLVPFLAAAVPMMALLITAAFFVEQAFGIPGAAAYFVSAAKNRDYPMVMGLTVVVALVVVAANLLADVVAAALDPRLRERRA